jgi:hypothetical protein
LSTVSGYTELTDYWYREGSKYYFVKGSIDFAPVQYGKFEVASIFSGRFISCLPCGYVLVDEGKLTVERIPKPMFEKYLARIKAARRS